MRRAKMAMVWAIAVVALSCHSAIAAEYVGVVVTGDSGSYVQALVMSDGSTFRCNYSWPSYLVSPWVPGTNIFDAAGMARGEVVSTASDVAFTASGDVLVFGGFQGGIWGFRENVPASAGVPNLSPFISYVPSSFQSHSSSLFTVAVTRGGAVYLRRTVVGTSGEPEGWSLSRPEDSITASHQRTFGQVKASAR